MVHMYLLGAGAGSGGGSGPVALAWATPAWLICAGFAATKPSALISSGGGRSNAWARCWLGRRTVCATLSVTGSSTGLLRSLTCLLVPFCRVILIGLLAWTICTHPLPGSTSKGIDRCFGTSMPAQPSQWWAPVPPRTMALPWLNSWAVLWPRRVGPSSVVLRKGLMLQPIAAVWPETAHLSRCWGHPWIVSIQRTTDRCNSRSAGKGCWLSLIHI